MNTVPARGLDDREVGSLQFIDEALLRDPSIDDSSVVAGRPHVQRLTGKRHAVPTWITPQRSMHLLDDVAAHAELTELLLPTGRERPRRSGNALGEAEAREVPEPGDE